MNTEYTYKQIADYFIALSNETQSLITNLKLQKLLYYAQAWYLAIYNRPLFNDDFEAWVHGPVLRALYDDYKHFSWKPIEREDLGEGSFSEIEKSFDGTTQKFMRDLTDEYFGENTYELERLTHSEDPWKKARAGISEDQPSTAVIDKTEMQSYYSQYIQDAEAQKK